MTMTINRLDRIPGSAEALIRATTFDTADLVPVIAQDARTGGVRMFAWANREALRRTVETGLAHFWSRSRQAIWRKGETSGNVLRVRDIRLTRSSRARVRAGWTGRPSTGRRRRSTAAPAPAKSALRDPDRARPTWPTTDAT